MGIIPVVNSKVRYSQLSKGAMGELLRASEIDFRNFVNGMHFTEINSVVREFQRRVKILGDITFG